MLIFIIFINFHFQYGGLKPELAIFRDFWTISKARYMFLLMAVQADMCATSSYNIRPSVFTFIIFMNFHFQYGGLKPEVVIFSLLMKIFEKFQILVICFRPWPFQCTCARHRPTMSDTQKIQYGGWETGSSYIYTYSQDIWAIPKGMIMFTCAVIPANTSAIQYNNARHQKNPIWRRKIRK